MTRGPDKSLRTSANSPLTFDKLNLRGRQFRVVRILTRLNIGGPAYHAILLTAGTEARYPTLLVTGSVGTAEGDITDMAVAHDIPLMRIPELGRNISPMNDLRVLWKLWTLCRCLKPEIVHTHTAKAGALGRLAAWLAGVPIRVHTFHGHVFHGYFGRFKTALFVIIERYLARMTTRIVAISPGQSVDIQKYLKVPADRIAIVPLGLELDRFARDDADTLRAKFRDDLAVHDEIVILVVGRLTRIKNQALAMSALPLLRKADSRFILALVGGGEDEQALKKLAESLGVADRVRFLGWRHDMAAVYYGSDIVALTSDNEGTPVCLIEALACGKPVVATAVGGVPDLLREGALGLLVPPGDVEAFVSAMVSLIDLSAREHIARGGPQDVRVRFDISRLVTDIEQLYDTLLMEHVAPISNTRTS